MAERRFDPDVAGGGTGIGGLVRWARSQMWVVPEPGGSGRVPFTAPDGAFVVAWSPAVPAEDVVAAVRRYGLVWPPPPRRPRGGRRR